ncbi:MAG: parallel beta-helix domain-containing protein, partial [Bacteroidota bacterium]
MQTQFIMVEDGGTIELAAGKVELNASLWMDDKKNVTIKGMGMDKTILSFKNQKEGAEGIKITNSKNITIEGLTVQNAKGDAIKTQMVDGINFLKVKTEWTGRPKKTNGAYGLYPVQCSNVLIDGCEAVGASDAGIYVGQSDRIVVRNSRAYKNVAGIEIENSTNADVYNCEAINNTGGILVFDLPGLIKKRGGNVRVYDNKIIENNYKNFAPPGNTVGTIPPGSGIIVLATSDVEIFNNEVRNNKSVGATVISYYLTETPWDDDEYDPYPSRISIHDNSFVRKRKMPGVQKRMGKLLFLKFGKKVPDIIVDGIYAEESLTPDGRLKTTHEICIKNNGNATFANLDASNDFKNLTRDRSHFDCEREQLVP